MKKLKIALVQMDSVIGDFAGNLAKAKAFAAEADAAGADLAVFPEMALTGYYPHDLLLRPDFVEAGERALAELAAFSAGLRAALAIGVVGRSEAPGKPLRNGAAVLLGGQVVFEAWKQLLPTYDVFDERRHFEPGAGSGVFEIAGVPVGFLVCEDIWNMDGADYAVDPVEEAAGLGARVIVSLNASPTNLGKPERREAMFGELCRRRGLPLVYANRVGGQDELVFDGASFVLDAGGKAALRLPAFEEAFGVVEVCPESGAATGLGAEPLAGLPQGAGFMLDALVRGVRDYLGKLGIERALVGSSGGIDSAVVLALAALALGSEKVEAVSMPSRWSSEGSVFDSRALCENLGVKMTVHPIGALVAGIDSGYEEAFGSATAGTARENVQARLRGLILMERSNQSGALVLSTGNKSEMAVGYATLYGDMNGGLNPLGDLYKGEVYALAREINARMGFEAIPAAILDKEPSAELAPGQKDSDALPPYPVLDEILRAYLERGAWGAESVRARAKIPSTFPDAEIARVLKLCDGAEFKRRQAPPIVRVHAKAFGFGRRIPVVKSRKWMDE